MRTPDAQSTDAARRRRRSRRGALALGAVAVMTVGPAASAFALPPPDVQLPGTTFEPPPTQAQDPTPLPADTNEALNLADQRLQNPGCRDALRTPIGDPLQLLRALRQKPGTSGIWDTGAPRVTADGDPIYAEPSQNGAGADGQLLLFQAFHTITMEEAQAEGLSSPADLRAEIIVHELWHLLGAVHGNNPAATAAFDASVKRACFPEAPVPPEAAGYLDAGYTPVIVDAGGTVLDGGSGPLPDSNEPEGYSTDVVISGADDSNSVTYDPNTGLYEYPDGTVTDVPPWGTDQDFDDGGLPPDNPGSYPDDYDYDDGGLPPDDGGGYDDPAGEGGGSGYEDYDDDYDDDWGYDEDDESFSAEESYEA